MNAKHSARYNPRATEFVVFSIENTAKSVLDRFLRFVEAVELP